MDEFDILRSAPLEKKKACAECPRLELIQQMLDELDAEKISVVSAAEIDDSFLGIGDSLIHVTDVDSGESADLTLEDVTLLLRQGAAEQLDHFDEHETAYRNNGAALQKACRGILEFCTVDHEGRTILTIICGSPLTNELTSFEPARVIRL